MNENTVDQLNNVGKGATTPHSAKNLHITFHFSNLTANSLLLNGSITNDIVTLTYILYVICSVYSIFL